MTTKTRKKQKIKACPNCGVNWASGWLGYDLLSKRTYCMSCQWNTASERQRVTREQYQYWYRLKRLRHRSWQVHPPKRKQPEEILSSVMHHVFARDVPRWIQEHLDDVYSWRYKQPHHWIFQSKSRWEYHLWMEDGVISSPQEYQAEMIARREWEADQPPDDLGAFYYDDSDY